MLSVTAIGLMLGASALGANVPAIYLPYLQDNPPEIVEELPEQRIGDVIVREFWFVPRDIPGVEERYEVHSILARPVQPGPHPAILFCHGGGGYTHRERSCIIGWARRGYVCIGQDQPGFTSGSGLTRGPSSRVVGALSATPDATASPLFDGIVAVLRSLSILRNHPDVDTNRIGVFGGSWGGYMTTMTAALAGEKIAAAFSIYGAGYYDLATTWTTTLRAMPEAERGRWIAAFDPGRLAGNISADYMILQATNDWFFWPPSVERTLDNIPAEGPSPRKNWLFAPNDYHAIRYPGGTGAPEVDHREHRTYMELRFMDGRLKGEAATFPTVEAMSEPVRDDDSIRVRFTATSELPLTGTEVYWSGGEMPWRMRWWEAVEAEEIGDSVYEALLPVRHAGKRLDWVGVIGDEGSATVSTRIRRIEPTDLGFDENAHPAPATMADMQRLLADQRWRWAAGTKRSGEGFGHRLVEKAGREGGAGHRITGIYAIGAWGVRAADLKSAGATGVRLWVRSADETPVDGFHVSLTVEVDGGTRYFFNAQSVEGLEIGPQWRMLELPWNDFQCQVGDGAPHEGTPVDLLSDGLGELQLSITDEREAVYVDDMEFMDG